MDVPSTEEVGMSKLEALKLAVATYQRFPNVDEDKILECAAKYDKFITDVAEGNSVVNPPKQHSKAAPFRK